LQTFSDVINNVINSSTCQTVLQVQQLGDFVVAGSNNLSQCLLSPPTQLSNMFNK